MSSTNPLDPRRTTRHTSAYLSPERANERTIGLASLLGLLRTYFRR